MAKFIFFYFFILLIIGCTGYGPRDTEPPTIEVYSPTNGQILNSTNIIVRGVAKETTNTGFYLGIKLVELLAYHAISSNSEGWRTIFSEQNSNIVEFNWESIVNFIEYGSNEIKARCFDKAYNESPTIIIKVFVLSN